MWCVHVLYMYVLMYVVDKTFLKFMYRYCMPSGPIERFLTFIHIRSHTREDLVKYLLQYLEQNGINIQNCRGQSYDNSSNMSEKYIGMQTFREVYIHICEMRNCRLVVVCALVVHSLITSSDLIITHA